MVIKRGVFNKTTDGNTTSILLNHLTKSHTHVHLRLLEMGGNDIANIVQRGTVRKLFKMEKTKTVSKGIIQGFTHLVKPYDPKSRQQLKFEDGIIILFAEVYTPPSIV